MAVVSCVLLLSPTRLFTPLRLRLAARGQPVLPAACVSSMSSPRPYSSAPPNSSDVVSCGLEKYKDLQKYFNRRLRATYRRFYNTADHSVVCGRHHVYFIEGDGIYRMDKEQRDPEQVLNLEQVPEEEDTTLLEKRQRRKINLSVQRIRLSPEEKHLAATLKASDREEPRCVIVRLGRKPSDIVLTLDKVLTFEWVTDDSLFYTTLEGLRCSRVFHLDLTSDENRITTVYEEKQPDVFVEVALTRDRQILSINCNSRTSSEVLLMDTTGTSLKPRLVQPRQLNLLYHVEHWRGTLIMLANTGLGREYQVVRAPLSEPSMDSWVPVFVPDPGTVLKDMDIVGDHCVLTARTAANELVLIVVALTYSEKVYTVPLPPWACAIEINKPDSADQHEVLEFLISSPVQPRVRLSLCLEDGLLSADREDVTSAENNKYSTTRLEACSQDGTLVPVTLFHAAAVESLRAAPMLVHVYGSYGRDLSMDFHPEKVLLLEQGWCLAYCHIRGGGERGLSWHRKAREDAKVKGVEDLRACLQLLFSLGISSPPLTALTARSAGAVPVGALCNRHAHMMQAVILQAPFVDVLGTMQDPSLPLTLEDREEWGDPATNPKHILSISSYCPLHNITPQRYPSMLLTAYRDDARIPLAGVLKYTKHLQNAVLTQFSTNPQPELKQRPNIVLNIQPGSNHLGPEDFELMLEEEALNLAFLYEELDLRPSRHKRRRK